MLASVVLYTTANLCVKELSHLGTFQLVFLRSAVSLALCAAYLKRAGILCWATTNDGWCCAD